MLKKMRDLTENSGPFLRPLRQAFTAAKTGLSMVALTLQPPHFVAVAAARHSNPLSGKQ